MENQNKQQTTNRMPEKENTSKRSKRTFLILGIMASLFAILRFAFTDSSASRPSTGEEIAKQIAFQEKWKIEEQEAEQKWDSLLKSGNEIK